MPKNLSQLEVVHNVTTGEVSLQINKGDALGGSQQIARGNVSPSTSMLGMLANTFSASTHYKGPSIIANHPDVDMTPGVPTSTQSNFYGHLFKDNGFSITVPKTGNPTADIELRDGQTFKNIPVRQVETAPAPK